MHEVGGELLSSRCLLEMELLTRCIAELEKSTDMFRRLADPDGANNALSQVLYGLALRCVSLLSTLLYCLPVVR